MIIVGFGLIGRNLAQVLRATSIPYVVLELNPRTVREERRRGEDIHRGDASRPEVLSHLGVASARAVVLAINDPDGLRRAVGAVKRQAPGTWLIVRTHYVLDMDELYRLGADDVVPEEFETSIEIFSRVLLRYDVPPSVIRREVDGVRGERYQALRDGTLPGIDALLTGVEVIPLRLSAEHWSIGRSMVDLDLRARTGAQAVAIVREDHPVSEPARTPLAAGDVVVLSGMTASVEVASDYLRRGPAALTSSA